MWLCVWQGAPTALSHTHTKFSTPFPAQAGLAVLARTHDRDQADFVMCVLAFVCECVKLEAAGVRTNY